MSMPDSEKKKAWIKENTVMCSVKLNKNQDTEILDYYGGKVTAGQLKDALRYYIASHPKEYRYGMRLRGYSPGAQPKGVLRREDDTTGRYHDIIVYDRRLSADEIRNYELEELT